MGDRIAALLVLLFAVAWLWAIDATYPRRPAPEPACCDDDLKILLTTAEK